MISTRQSITKELFELLPQAMQPCISIYMPTHRKHPENRQDPIVFKNMLTELEQSLSIKYSKRDITSLLEPYKNLLDDNPFWNNTLDGLAILSTLDFFQVFVFPMAVHELCIVADTFYLKPLRKYLQTADRYQVISISQNNIELFEGNRHGLDKITLDSEIPHNLTDALGNEVRGKHLTVASYGGVGQESGAMHHGHGSKKDEAETDIERFLRIISKAIYENYSKKSQLPLILAAGEEYHPIFQQINKNPFLLTKGIEKNPESLSVEDLTEQSWDIMKPHYTKKINDLSHEFHNLKAQNLASDDIEEIAKATILGSVRILCIESFRQIAGKINKETGNIEPGNLSDPETNDLLEDIAQLVEQRGGTVMVLSKDDMPSTTGIVALFRY